MTEIHPTIEQLLSILDTSGLSRLADIARGRLDDIQGLRRRDFPGYDGDDRGSDELLARQRDIVGAVVNDVISRELDMRHRIRSISSKLEIGAVLELDDAGDGRLGVADNLSSPEQEAQLARFQSAWTALIRDLGGRLGDFSAG
jgi:hypothetical protein